MATSDLPPISHTVTVTNLSSTTTNETLQHFFSFCGKIDSIQHDGTTAKVAFVKESACKTALMLNGGTLDGSTISVTSKDVETPALANVQATKATAQTPSELQGHDVEQEDKPKSAIAAEYLAHGYALSDAAIQKAIEADQQYGISQRFLSFFTPLVERVQKAAQPHVETAQTKLQQVDEKQGLSAKANAAAIVGTKYYNAALASSWGAKVHAFYTRAEKNVRDVHEEALRIKESKRPSGTSTPTTSNPGVSSTTEPVASTGTAGVTSEKADDKPLETTKA
ncbi:hypothetical protein OIV83_003847 [Microbotryomycetes sp. JL201]|nr:hypothetical protein OIV83_003847 [Microbotryomycetes sp. JL201]